MKEHLTCFSYNIGLAKKLAAIIVTPDFSCGEIRLDIE
jgi:hypothetical protein